MAVKFNPFTGQLQIDEKGSGGGSSYIDGEVQNFSALPETLGSPAVDSAYLVREAEGTWLLNRKPAGIYIRTANTGTRASDWTYAGEFPDVFSDANLVVYNNTDSTKNVKFDASAIATGTTRTISVPDKNITLDDAVDSRTPTTHAASHNLDGTDEIFVEGLATGVNTAYHALVSTGQSGSGMTYGLQMSPAVLGAGALYQSDDLSAQNVQLACDITGTWTVANSDNLRTAIGAASDSHTHGNITNDGKVGSDSGRVLVTTTAGAVTTLALGTAGQVLTVNGTADGVEFAAASGGGVTAVGASTADVLSVSGSDLIADDGGTIDSSDPFIKWDDAAGKLVYANPLSRPSGAFYVGLAPTTTAIGARSINIQSQRSGATRVASGTDTIVIGDATATNGGIAIGNVGASATAGDALAFGRTSSASAVNSIAIGTGSAASLRGMLSAYTFNSVFWGGQTTNATPLILNLDATATSRFTIAANTALAVDILLVARRSDTQDKWLVARRFLGIRRDGSNNTSLIGSVQTLGTDQSAGSPTWTFALTADDTNEALQLEVTGAASETVQWRATAFYRVA